MTRLCISISIYLMSLFWVAIQAQTPFDCDGTVYCIIENTNEFGRLAVNATNNSVDLEALGSMGSLDIRALGYRKTDNLIYGIGRTDHHLYRIDANVNIEDLGQLALQGNLVYDAADIDPSGQFMYASGSLNGVDQELVKIDLNDFSIQNLPVAGGINLTDIAFHPYNGQFWAHDQNNFSFLSLDLGTLSYTGYNQILPENNMQGCYFDASGRLFSYGTSAFGVAGAIFEIGQSFGIENRRITGPVGMVTDLAACPYAIDLLVNAFPRTVFPCEEVEYTYYVANGTGQTISGVTFEHDFPAGFDVQAILRNPYGGNVTATGSDLIRIENMNIDAEIDSIILLVEVGDIAGGRYYSQARFTGLPVSFGGQRLSDDVRTFAPGDSVYSDINRIEEDSIFTEFFSCIGNTVELDASEYGANIQWNTGSTNQQLLVGEGGIYYLNVTGGCQEVYVEYDVSFASCPYTIELGYDIIPREALPCSEAIYRYPIENDSGLPRNGITFIDTLPPGFTPLDIIRNPFGGNVVNSANPQLIKIENMNLPLGIDTIEVLVEIGDLPPGLYPNRAIIEGFATGLGPFRSSDDPLTLPADSTIITILGVPTDSFYVDTIICARATLDLNASPYGFNYLWEDGSIDSILTVEEPGNYAVTILDGCEPSYVFFNVSEGDPIDLMVEDEVTVFLGESHTFLPTVVNFGDSLFVQWNAEVDSTLSCLNCLETIARPLRSTFYTLVVANEVCTDSTFIEFTVDNTRRIYAPNIFSANRDGLNDYFYLQSPDFGKIKTLRIYSRWGSIVYSSDNSLMNTETTGWNGRANNTGKPLEPGVYLWQAEIEFLDGFTETFGGDVMLLR